MWPTARYVAVDEERLQSAGRRERDAANLRLVLRPFLLPLRSRLFLFSSLNSRRHWEKPVSGHGERRKEARAAWFNIFTLCIYLFSMGGIFGVDWGVKWAKEGGAFWFNYYWIGLIGIFTNPFFSSSESPLVWYVFLVKASEIFCEL